MAQEFFLGTYFGSTLEQYALFFATVIVFGLARKIFNYFLQHHMKKLSARTKTKFDDTLLESSKSPVMLFSVISGLFFGTFFLTIPEAAKPFFSNVLGGLFIAALVWFFLKLANAVISEIIVPMARSTDSKLDDQLIPIIAGGLKGVIIAIGAIVILSNFGYDVTAIIAGLGIGGLAVAFAAQQTIADAFGGVNIFVSKPFLVGDSVEIEGIVGTVEKVGLRHTRIRDLDSRLNTISNSRISQAIVKNRSTEPGRKIKMSLGLTYATSVKKLKLAMQLAEKILRTQKNVDPTAIVTGFDEFGAFSLNILVTYIISEKNPDKIQQTKNDINLQIKEQFEKNKIDFAFPTQTVYLQK